MHIIILLLHAIISWFAAWMLLCFFNSSTSILHPSTFEINICTHQSTLIGTVIGDVEP